MTQIIAITLPYQFEGEAEEIERLLDMGIDRIHIRKTGNNGREETEELISNISENYYSRISLHYFPEIAVKYSTGGIHYSPKTGNEAIDWNGMRSASCHTLEEVIEKAEYDYVLLSPIFDSISKEGYRSTFDIATLKHAAEKGIIGQRTYALGGIKPEHMPLIEEIGFGGAAILGGLWGDANDGKIAERAKAYLDAAKRK